MLSLERRYHRNKFRYFPLSSLRLREVDIRFYVVAGAPGHRRTTCQFHVCVAYHTVVTARP